MVVTPGIELQPDAVHTWHVTPALPGSTVLAEVLFSAVSRCSDVLMANISASDALLVSTEFNMTTTKSRHRVSVGHNISSMGSTEISISASECSAEVYAEILFYSIESGALTASGPPHLVMSDSFSLTISFNETSYVNFVSLSAVGDCDAVDGLISFDGGETQKFNLTENSGFAIEAVTEGVEGVVLLEDNRCDVLEVRLSARYYTLGNESVTVSPDTEAPPTEAPPTESPGANVTEVPETEAPKRGGGGSDGLSRGALIAIIVGAVAAVAGAGGLVFYCKRPPPVRYEEINGDGLINSR